MKKLFLILVLVLSLSVGAQKTKPNVTTPVTTQVTTTPTVNKTAATTVTTSVRPLLVSSKTDTNNVKAVNTTTLKADTSVPTASKNRIDAPWGMIVVIAIVVAVLLISFSRKYDKDNPEELVSTSDNISDNTPATPDDEASTETPKR
jgi:uncharacterized membrane protein affecting hemolysin expression